MRLPSTVRARELVETLGLAPHPERGWYSETYRSPLQIDPFSGAGARAASTAIYFLLTRDEPATFLHKLKSDELFHLYEGGPLEVLMLSEGSGRVRRLGRKISEGERPQMVIPAGTWFGTVLAEGVEHALFGCTVAPGFEFADFELAQGPELSHRFPEFSELIRMMTR